MVDQSSHVFVLDVDGTLTDGGMYYTEQGKQTKKFGCDDWNAIELLAKHMRVHFISADRKGFRITQRRIEEECGYELDLVPGDGQERWDFISRLYGNKKVIYMGDGILDSYPLLQSDYGITTKDALKHVQLNAQYVTEHSGGNRAVAEAILHVFSKYKIGPIGL